MAERRANRNYIRHLETIEELLENGAGGGGTPYAVKYTAQSLSSSEQAQARTNIGAAASSALSGKQDTLVSGTNIKTVGGQSLLGSGNVTVNDTSAVKFDAAQSLTTAQKQQARQNIGAISADEMTNMEYVTAAIRPEASENTMGKIYMIGPDANDEYERYFTQEVGGVYSWVPLGSTEIDLSGYATDDELAQLDLKVDDLSTGKYYGYYATAGDLPDSDSVPGFAYVGSGPTYTIYNFNGTAWTSTGITVNQSPIGNDEDIDQNEDGKLQFANRVYDAQQPNGMGYKILRADKTFASQVTDTNTVFEIRYDFDLGGQTMNLPTNSVLLFNGGSISNGQLNGSRTKIFAELVKIFDTDVTFAGSWEVECIFPQWFGAVTGNIQDCTTAFQCAINSRIVSTHIRVPTGEYRFDGELSFVGNNYYVESIGAANWNYYGTSDFISFGKRTPMTECAFMLFEGGYFRAYDANPGNIFKIEYLVRAVFKDLYLRWGTNGVSCNHSDFRGMYYVTFDNVTCQANQLNGFDLRPQNNGQNNAISFLNCKVSAAGSTSYPTAPSTVNTSDGNGIVVHGSGINIIGGQFEVNGGCGIKFPAGAYCSSVSIIGAYYESNLYNTFRIEKLQAFAKIFIGEFYADNVTSYYNWYLPENFAKSGSEILYERIKEGTYKLYDYFHLENYKHQGDGTLFTGLPIPCQFKFKKNSGGYTIVFPSMCVGGEMYSVHPDCQYNKVTAISDVNGVITITLQTALDDNYTLISPVTTTSPLYPLPESILSRCGLLIRGFSDGKFSYSISGTTGATTIVCSATVSTRLRDLGLAVGNVVYLGKNNTKNTTVSGSSSYSLPSAFEALPDTLQKCLCLTFITDANTEIDFEYFTAYKNIVSDGTTRPTSAPIGFRFFDENLGKPIFYKGAGVWVDATGATV